MSTRRTNPAVPASALRQTVHGLMALSVLAGWQAATAPRVEAQGHGLACQETQSCSTQDAVWQAGLPAALSAARLTATYRTTMPGTFVDGPEGFQCSNPFHARYATDPNRFWIRCDQGEVDLAMIYNIETSVVEHDQLVLQD